MGTDKLVKVYDTKSPEETEQVGRDIAKMLASNSDEKCFVCLFGDLGAGKTAFVRGFAGELSPGCRVKSPTYTVVNEYRNGETPVFHFDLYRLGDDEDGLVGIGFDEYVKNGHCIFEWSEYMPENEKPRNAAEILIEKTGDETRRITVKIQS